MAWVKKRGIRLEHIQPEKPLQNAYIERYNRTARGEWLGQYSFETIEEHKARHRIGSGLTTTSDPTWASTA